MEYCSRGDGAGSCSGKGSVCVQRCCRLFMQKAAIESMGEFDAPKKIQSNAGEEIQKNKSFRVQQPESSFPGS